MPKRSVVFATNSLNKKVKLSNVSRNSNINLVNNLTSSSTMHPEQKIEILNNPVKSAGDRKEYRVIRLQNGLTACLVSDTLNPEALLNNVYSDESESDSEVSAHDSDTELSSSDYKSSDEREAEDRIVGRLKLHNAEEKLAAASLCIGVGSFSDPETIPGLAHFLEHMVFMGSEKYPQENDFDAFLKKHGGSDNAATDCETTSFYFECLEQHLAKALDKFAQFFISPLMKREAMTREREAIESEFQMALPSDTYRKEQLLASFSRAGNPANKFLWGNLVTLRDNVADDVLYNDVHEFRKRHYSAHRMTLAIQARLPLDTLESYVVNCFSAVPNNGEPGHDFRVYSDDIFNNSNFKRIYYIKPVKDICQVDLTWVMPSLLHLYKSKPHQYVSWLMGHEGKGGLLSYLREKLWALAIYSGNGESGLEYNSMYALFTVTLVLTPEGLDHIFEIIEAVFSYISLLQKVGPQQRIYEEIKTIEDTSFRFHEEETAVDFVEDLAECMQYYPPEDYITGDDLYFEYNPEAISMVLDKLNPNNLNIMVSSSTLNDQIVYDKVEQWFSTNYTDKDIPIQWIERWSKVEPMPCFSLPEKNKFLTTNFDLLDLSNYVVPTYPEKIKDSCLSELWYKPDDKFKLPNAFINYYFMNVITQESVVNECLLDLFITVLELQLTEDIYPAHVAELGYSISASNGGIVVKVDGYNDKLPLLVQLIVTYMKNVSVATTEELFKAVKDKQARSYYNTFLKPSKLSKSLRLSILLNIFWSPLEKYNAISKVTYDMFKEFSSSLLKKLHIRGLIQGNISKEVALTINDDVISILNCEPVPVEQLPQKRVRGVNVGQHCCKVMSFNKDDSNSIVTNYYQFGPGTLKVLMIIEILMLIMEEPLFDVLRTKEQLGYHVYCSLCDTFGILGFSITVNAQAQKCTVEHVDKRIEAFLKTLTKTIKRMPDKKIVQVQSDLVKVKQLVDVHLRDEVSRNWNEIIQQDFMFDRLPREISAIDEVKVSDVRKWLDTFSLNEKYSRKISFQVVGHKKEPNESDSPLVNPKSNIYDADKVQDELAETEEYKIKFVNNVNRNNSDCIYITDLEKFKKNLYMFPEHKIKS